MLFSPQKESGGTCVREDEGARLALGDVRLIQLLAPQRSPQAVHLPGVVDVDGEVVRPAGAEESALAIPVRLGQELTGNDGA